LNNDTAFELINADTDAQDAWMSRWQPCQRDEASRDYIHLGGFRFNEYYKCATLSHCACTCSGAQPRRRRRNTNP